MYIMYYKTSSAESIVHSSGFRRWSNSCHHCGTEDVLYGKYLSAAGNPAAPEHATGKGMSDGHSREKGNRIFSHDNLETYQIMVSESFKYNSTRCPSSKVLYSSHVLGTVKFLFCTVQ